MTDGLRSLMNGSQMPLRRTQKNDVVLSDIRWHKRENRPPLLLIGKNRNKRTDNNQKKNNQRGRIHAYTYICMHVAKGTTVDQSVEQYNI